ncbi:MAG: hypothetical protein COV70_02690 [Parcubacteria group bacterium CG11_big_fil_rev_8_21_14_0_20_39_22]|nr:MAG: hypothetical protein COV70_02690 [Parcubacteria group bacterium CG11_big_fil_rev_8_21_14_0_20_39_22]
MYTQELQEITVGSRIRFGEKVHIYLRETVGVVPDGTMTVENVQGSRFTVIGKDLDGKSISFAFIKGSVLHEECAVQ